MSSSSLEWTRKRGVVTDWYRTPCGDWVAEAAADAADIGRQQTWADFTPVPLVEVCDTCGCEVNPRDYDHLERRRCDDCKPTYNHMERTQ